MDERKRRKTAALGPDADDGKLNMCGMRRSSVFKVAFPAQFAQSDLLVRARLRVNFLVLCLILLDAHKSWPAENHLES